MHTWKEVSEEATSEAVRYTLRLPTYAHDGGDPAKACLVICSQQCN